METTDYRIVNARKFLATGPGLDRAAENTELRHLLSDAIAVADDWAAGEPKTTEDIERMFPGWHAWQGVNGLWYARLPGTSPCLTAEPAKDLINLKEQIAATIYRWDNGPIR
jgi:hypothetical protein